MRSVLHFGSQVDAARSLGKSSNSRQEQRELPAHPAPAIAQSDASLNTAPKRATSTRPQDVVAVSNRTATNVDDYPKAQHSTDRDGDGDEAGSNEPKKPVIVIIHNRTVFRDCLAQCLEIAYVDHDVRTFSNIVEWRTCEEPATLDAAVTIIVIDGFNEAGAADLDFLETSTMTNPVIIVSDTDDLNHIIRVLKSGARGYIPTSLSFNVAVEAVR